MDLALLANFSRQFPKAPTISNLENARRERIIRGNRGRIIAEREKSGTVMLCDDQYLASFVDEMKSIEMEPELWRLKCKKPCRRFSSKFNPSNVTPPHQKNSNSVLQALRLRRESARSSLGTIWQAWQGRHVRLVKLRNSLHYLLFRLRHLIAASSPP